MQRDSIAGFAVAAMIALGLAWGYSEVRDLRSVQQQARQSDEAVAEAAAEVAELEARIATSNEKLRELESDPVEREAAIRRIYHRVRPGETVYRIELDASAGTEP